MKKFFAVFIMIFVMTALAGCGDAAVNEPAQPAPPAPAQAAPEPAPTPAAPEPVPATPAQAAPAQDAESQDLAGTWLWRGSPYYVLEPDGSGTMAGSDILWSVADGVFIVCSTPAICGNTCILPSEWYYILDGDELTLTSRVIPGMYFVYTRR